MNRYNNRLSSEIHWTERHTANVPFSNYFLLLIVKWNCVKVTTSTKVLWKIKISFRRIFSPPELFFGGVQGEEKLFIHQDKRETTFARKFWKISRNFPAELKALTNWREGNWRAKWRVVRTAVNMKSGGRGSRGWRVASLTKRTRHELELHGNFII